MTNAEIFEAVATDEAKRRAGMSTYRPGMQVWVARPEDEEAAERFIRAHKPGGTCPCGSDGHRERELPSERSGVYGEQIATSEPK